MKKYIGIAMLALVVALVSSQAFAYRGGCPGGGPGNGPGAVQQEWTADQKAEFDKFFDATKPLREKLFADRVELRAIMRSDNPDAKAARALAESMNETRNQIIAKAEELGVNEFAGPGSCLGGRGGRGFGPGHGGYGQKGYGPGNCPAYNTDDNGPRGSRGSRCGRW